MNYWNYIILATWIALGAIALRSALNDRRNRQDDRRSRHWRSKYAVRKSDYPNGRPWK